MSGWLYAISGVMLALLAIALVVPERSLRHLRVTRRPIEPVSVGDRLRVELAIENRSNQRKSLIQIRDVLPYVLGQPVSHAIELIGPQSTYHWVYEHPTPRRGVFRWQCVDLRTAAPLGLFWCRRQQQAQAIAYVYPNVLPLSQCPLIDEMGREQNAAIQSNARTLNATEGVTKTLRPYRWGDPTRLIHWRTSARFGELRVRELELFTGGQDVVICLDSGHVWEAEQFEQAVTAAASLYFYALRRSIPVSVWTAATGQVRGERAVLEVLAATHAGEEARAEGLPGCPIIWLSQTAEGLTSLPVGSRWLLWRSPQADTPAASRTPEGRLGRVMYPEQPLQRQLQAPL